MNAVTRNALIRYASLIALLAIGGLQTARAQAVNIPSGSQPGLYLNMWVEAPGSRFGPVQYLEPDRDYRIVADLAMVDYADGDVAHREGRRRSVASKVRGGGVARPELRFSGDYLNLLQLVTGDDFFCSHR